jgi:hypothetical protein
MNDSTYQNSKTESADNADNKNFSPLQRITGWFSAAINNHFDRLLELRVYDNKRN